MTIRQFHITPYNLSNLIDKLMHLDPTRQWLCSVTEKKSQRSIQQNKWIRGFASDFGKYLGYTEDQMYEILMYKFCPEFVQMPDGEEVRMPGHFSKHADGTKRNTKEAAEIQDHVQQWAAECGFIWHDLA